MALKRFELKRPLARLLREKAWWKRKNQLDKIKNQSMKGASGTARN